MAAPGAVFRELMVRQGMAALEARKVQAAQAETLETVTPG
jgi:hypothetical protein